jgi:hypothetical protein
MIFVIIDFDRWLDSQTAPRRDDGKRLKMTRARLDGLYLLLLGSLVFLLLGVAMENAAPAPLADFKALYYPARCLIQHADPYMEGEVLRIYRAEGGDRPSDAAKIRQIATQNVYPPTAFSFTVPFAMLPWGPAHMLWTTLTLGSLVFASFLIWNLGADYAPVLSGALIGFLLTNSELLVITGNAAGIVISLCAVAVWCFLRQRFVLAGILCLALSLALKPQDAGLVWLYFLLAGGVYRKRALQTLLATVAISLPCVLWVWQIAPDWMRELHFNILAFSAPGGINDPGLASTGGHGLDMLVSLQTAVSFFRDDPRIYNPVSYFICGSLLLLWAFVTLRSRSSPRRAWLALATIAALSLLPVYHRQVDAKLLLLTVPACAMLWAEGGLIGRLALLVNAAGFLLTGDIPWAIVLGLIGKLHPPPAGLSGQILIAVQVFPAPLILLVMGIFYLWVYARRCSAHASPPTAAEPC